MSIQVYHPRTINEIDGFTLVGSEKAHYWCGIWQTFGCLKHKTAYVRQFKRTCFRANCKVCYVSWASRQAKRSVKKLNSMKKNNILRHIVVTTPTLWDQDTKKKLIESLKLSGIESACIIYTPFDESDNGKFFLKNTLHIFYYGKLVNLYNMELYKIYEQDDLDGDNQTLFRILQRQYLNCGIKKGVHPVSWIGKTILQYCTLESDNPKSNGKNCPLCNRKLHLIYYTGDREPIPPDEYFDGETERDGWEYCTRESFWKKVIRKLFFRNIIKKIITVSYKFSISIISTFVSV